MSGMTEPRALFLHELGDILYAEKVLVKALPKLAKEATTPSWRRAFEAHLEETKQHVASVEQVFEQLGEKAKAERCPGIEGIKAEHDEFMTQEEPSEEITDLFLTGAAARAEHYEIAAYEGLIAMAKALGETKSATAAEQEPEARNSRVAEDDLDWQETDRRLGAREGCRLERRAQEHGQSQDQALNPTRTWRHRWLASTKQRVAQSERSAS